MGNELLVKEKKVKKDSEIVKIAIAEGDGIGPEIMKATLKVLKAAGARIETESMALGEQVYLAGNSAGIEKNA